MNVFKAACLVLLGIALIVLCCGMLLVLVDALIGLLLRLRT